MLIRNNDGGGAAGEMNVSNRRMAPCSDEHDVSERASGRPKHLEILR